MSTILLENTRNEPSSLERECPQILRAILYLVRTLEGFNRPLSHPTRGVHGEYILELARDPHHLVTLTRIVQNLPITGWSIFHGIRNAVKHYDVLFTDVATLLGSDPSGKRQSLIRWSPSSAWSRNEPLHTWFACIVKQSLLTCSSPLTSVRNNKQFVKRYDLTPILHTFITIFGVFQFCRTKSVKHDLYEKICRTLTVEHDI